MTPTVAILAGGASRRMGTDKAALPNYEQGGQSWLACAAQAALNASLPTIIIGRTQPAEWTLSGVTFYDDSYPGEGPLGGILTAFSCCQGPLMVIPCDMPDLNAELITWLLGQWNSPQDQVLSMGPDHHVNPLCALYDRSCCALFDASFAVGERSPLRLFSLLRTRHLQPPHPDRLRDKDTPTDLQDRKRRCA